MGTFEEIMIGLGLALAITFLLYCYRNVRPLMERDCLPLLKVWLEENGLTLYWQCWYGMHCQSDLFTNALPTALFRVVVEDTQGRRRKGWAAITGRPSCGGEFIARGVAVRWGSPRKVAASKPKEKIARARDKSLWDDWVDLG